MYDIYITSNYGIRDEVVETLEEKYNVETGYSFDAITTKKKIMQQRLFPIIKRIK